jgi:hypothetical protein
MKIILEVDSELSMDEIKAYLKAINIDDELITEISFSR